MERVKLIDFAFSVRVTPDVKISKYCGSVAYMSPEVSRRLKFDPRKADVWSLGVTAYRLFAGNKKAFEGRICSNVKIK